MVTQHPLQVSVNNNTIDFSLVPSAWMFRSGQTADATI